MSAAGAGRALCRLVAAVALGAGFGCAAGSATVRGEGAPAAGGSSSSASGQGEIGDFELDTIGGERVRLSELTAAGHVVLVSFWATWCEPCKLELPHLERLQKELGGDGLRVLAISVDGPDSLGDVRSFVRSRGMKIPVLLDTERQVTARLNPRVMMPYWILVDRSGRVVRTHQGYLPGDEKALEAEVRATLAVPAGG